MALATHTFLRESRDEIVREWEASVQREPRVVTLADATLRNHIPALLDALASWMERDEPPGGERMRVAAIGHAAQRLEHAYQLTQLIQEVRLLRTTILRLLLGAERTEQEQEGNNGMAVRVVELARLNAGLDYVITDAVEHFVAERERQLAEGARRETEARESDRRKSEFLAVLSHELRNPLAPIHNALHILDRAQPGSEQAARARAVIHRQTQHLTRLIDDLMDVTRISRGRIELHRERLDLREVVRSTCEDLHSSFEEREIELRLEAPAGAVWIDADRTRISQILGNLLHNAGKFTPGKGTVNVVVASSPGHAFLRVRDNGAGIEDGMLGRVFEPFVQAPQDRARSFGGLGLGLSLVKALAELHGGSVSARSDGPGHGSEFLVDLPLAPPPGKPQRAGSAVAAAPRLVLIIEDNVDAAQTLGQALELGGHHTRLAFDARSGIALALELKPDVILCDIGLPDMDGYEVARTLRANGDLRRTRLVALSGYAQPEDRQRAKDAGFDAHLAKPPPLDQLNELLAREP